MEKLRPESIGNKPKTVQEMLERAGIPPEEAARLSAERLKLPLSAPVNAITYEAVMNLVHEIRLPSREQERQAKQLPPASNGKA